MKTIRLNIHLTLTTALICLAMLRPCSLGATTLVVYNTADSGAGSLRAALAAATNGDMIGATGVSGTITLTSGELLITNNLIIAGPGAAKLAINGNAVSRVFHISNNVAPSIFGLTITNGVGFNGGGIYVDSAGLTVSNCVIAGNIATNGGGIYINGHQSYALLTIVNSTLGGNFAQSSAGGIFNDASSQGIAQLEMWNCTISSNSATGGVGGIYNFAPNGDAEAYIYDSTFAGNSGSGAGAILNFAGTFPTFMMMGNTILKAGLSGPNVVSGGVASFSSNGYNLCSDNGGGLFTNTTDQINTDPLLGPLANNGGPTPTMALLPGSPAIDQGESFGYVTDQRGAPRPFDFPDIVNAPGGDGSDIGAFEVQLPPLNIQRAGNAAVLSWPNYYGNFSVQTNGSVTASGGWGNAPGTAFVIGTQYVLTNSPLSGNRFFRLKSN